jgi:hypothetical protein
MQHKNLCEYAEDETSLYKAWDEDLSRQIGRRDWSERIAYASFIGALLAWHFGQPELGVLIAIIGSRFVFSAIHYMIDASNVNYLMHQWDLNATLRRFSMTRSQRLGLREKQYFVETPDAELS